MSLARVLGASAKDVDPGEAGFRAELDVLGAIEDWFSKEGVDPTDTNFFSYENQTVGVFFRENNWDLRIMQSPNFPDVHKVVIQLPVVAVEPNQASAVLDAVTQVPLNAHFSVDVSIYESEDDLDGYFFLSMVATIGAEPKNMQLSIGTAISDMLSYVDSFVAQLAAIPGAIPVYTSN